MSLAGKIGEQARVEMDLVRNGATFTGTYAYVRVGTPLAMRGSVDPAGHVTLEEEAAGGNVTGVFRGTLDANGGFAGTWSAPGGSKSLPFTLAAWQGPGAPRPHAGSSLRRRDAAAQRLQGRSSAWRQPIVSL